MLSTPSSSTPRATGTGPPSQLTASVVKFQCLFTHDLRRKLKRWQDGYLRYHAFNKRIMVYDEQGNFVGDHHWRSTEEVLDGDEFELDKGVLIQVGERMSTTQTDISNLFEKRKSSQTSPQSYPGSQQPRPSTAVRSSGSSQPFRSLNDLLGIRKTPIGHLVSPHEERHRVPLPSSTVQPSEPERAPKRQKVSAPARDPVHHRVVQNEVVDLTDDRPVLAKSRNSASMQEKTRSPIDTRPSLRPPPRDQPKDPPTRPTRPASPVFAKPPIPVPSESSESRPAKPTARVTAKPTRSEAPELSSPPSSYLPPPSPPQRPRMSASDASAMPWRMPMQKPRKKLMYTALLPGGSSPKTPAPLSKPTPEKPNRQLASKARESQAFTSPAQELASTNAEFFPSDSTQFILEEMADTPGCERLDNPTKAQNSSIPRNLPAKRSLDAPLRKSLSDPTALTARPSLQARPTLMRSAMSMAPEPAKDVEEGPWTPEALDLFDFWPPGRPKPGSLA